ncbi:MAG TPA: FAD-binding oxidoreductase, partial [Oscillatoriaceae cyanobacterium]
MPHIAAEAIPLNLAKPSAPLMVTCLENVDLTPDSPHDNRHIVLDLGDSGFRYLEGQSVGVVPPGLDKNGKPHRLRLYSIASSRYGDDGEGKTISLLVKRTVYTDADSGEEVQGVASSYLCDLKPGDRVPLIGPVGKHFLL